MVGRLASNEGQTGAEGLTLRLVSFGNVLVDSRLIHLMFGLRGYIPSQV